MLIFIVCHINILYCISFKTDISESYREYWDIQYLKNDLFYCKFTFNSTKVLFDNSFQVERK